jgi:hypothetical protein
MRFCHSATIQGSEVPVPPVRRLNDVRQLLKVPLEPAPPPRTFAIEAHHAAIDGDVQHRHIGNAPLRSMPMAKPLDWRNVLAPDVIRQIEDEMGRKFAEGWYAYERALQGGMREIAPPPEVRDHRPTDQGGSARRQAGPRAPRGYWDDLIVETLKSVEPDRLAYTDLMTRVQGRAREHHLARSSFNVSLERLEREGRIGKDGHSWFWRAPAPRVSRSDDEPATGGKEFSALPFEYAN